jgi:hypothetical protein
VQETALALLVVRAAQAVTTLVAGGVGVTTLLVLALHAVGEIIAEALEHAQAAVISGVTFVTSLADTGAEGIEIAERKLATLGMFAETLGISAGQCLRADNLAGVVSLGMLQNADLQALGTVRAVDLVLHATLAEGTLLSVESEDAVLARRVNDNLVNVAVLVVELGTFRIGAEQVERADLVGVDTRALLAVVLVSETPTVTATITSSTMIAVVTIVAITSRENRTRTATTTSRTTRFHGAESVIT